jgi:hypothetical protein
LHQPHCLITSPWACVAALAVLQGFIYNCPAMQQTPPSLRQRAARLIGAKCALMARVDAYGQDPMVGRSGAGRGRPIPPLQHWLWVGSCQLSRPWQGCPHDAARTGLCMQSTKAVFCAAAWVSSCHVFKFECSAHPPSTTGPMPRAREPAHASSSVECHTDVRTPCYAPLLPLSASHAALPQTPQPCCCCCAAGDGWERHARRDPAQD